MTVMCRAVIRTAVVWAATILVPSLVLTPMVSGQAAAQPSPRERSAATFAAMKSPGVDAGWRRPREDWSGARTRLAHDESWRLWFAAKRAAVDDWMTRRRDRVAWVAGWGHEFVSPVDGSFIRWTPEIPGEEVATLASSSDRDIAVTPAIFRAWVVKFRERHINTVRDAAMLWRLTDDNRYLDWVVAQLDFYADHLSAWPLQDRFYGPSRIFGQPLMEAVYLGKLAEAARLIRDHVSADRWQAWRARLFEPEVAMLNQSMHRIHNIAGYLRAAAAQVALLYDDQAMWAEAIDGPWGLRRQLQHGVTGDHLWFEQSIGYHEFALSGLLPLLMAAGLADRGAELSAEMGVVRNMLLAPNRLRFPDDSLPNPADNAALRLRSAPLRGALLRAYRVLPTPHGLAAARQTRNWDTLLDPPDFGPEAAPVLPAVVSRHFEATRFAILKAGGWQVFFHYGQLTGSHAQEELLNFEAHWGTTAISHNPFTVGYASPLHADYFTRGLSHNVALIDGAGSTLPASEPIPGPLPQRGEMLRFDPYNAIMSAVQPSYRGDVAVRRTLRIVDGELRDEVRIESPAGESRTLGLALHVQGRVESGADMAPVVDFARDRPAPFGYWRDVRRATYRDEASFRLDYPNGPSFRITFSVPGVFHVYLGSAPDSPVPARRDAFYLESEGTRVTFKTRIAPLAIDSHTIGTREDMIHE